MRISFLPAVLVSIAARLVAAVIIIAGPEPSVTLGAVLEWVRFGSFLFGAPAFFIFAGVRLWIARRKAANAGVLLASAAISVAILAANFGEAYGRLLWHKASYEAAAAQRPQAELVLLDWGEGPGPGLFCRYKEYLAIARGSAVQKIEAFMGHEINSRGDERGDVDGFFSAAWTGRYHRFHQGKFDACRMRIVHLMGPYYYAVDHC